MRSIKVLEESYLDGYKHGKYKSWYPGSGKLEMEGDFHLDKICGLWTTYYEMNGGVMSQGTYVCGKKTGLWTEYYISGMVEITCYYHDGLRHGQYNKYYDGNNKQAKIQGEFVCDYMDGIWTSYHENSVIAFESYYDRGQSYDHVPFHSTDYDYDDDDVDVDDYDNNGINTNMV